MIAHEEWQPHEDRLLSQRDTSENTRQTACPSQTTTHTLYILSFSDTTHTYVRMSTKVAKSALLLWLSIAEEARRQSGAEIVDRMVPRH